MTEIQKQPFNKRALSAMLMFISFILLPLSGIPLHYSRTDISEGMLEYFLSRASTGEGMLEHFLMSVHNMSALIFLIAVLIHLSLNWKSLMKYIATKTDEYFQFRKEMIIALFTVVLIVGLFSSHALNVH
jgi:cytochrome b561